MNGVVDRLIPFCTYIESEEKSVRTVSFYF